MNLLLLGYGKMGKAIEQCAVQRGHYIVHKIDRNNSNTLAALPAGNIDAALEFSTPQTAYYNSYQCLSKHIPVIAGTTGWLDQLPAIQAYCRAQHGTFFHAPNFSIGVNLFFHLNTFLAKQLHAYPGYDVSIEEIHHTEKQDPPATQPSP